MSKRGENIYLRKDGRWEGRYVKGRNRAGKTSFGYIYGKHYREVREKLTVARAERYAGRKPAEIFGNGTLSAWMDHWLYTRVRPEVKESTFQLYARLADAHIHPLLGKRPLYDVDEGDIRRLGAHLRKTLSASTTAGVLRLLKSALKHAQYKDLLVKNPFDTLRIARGERKSPRVLTVSEQKNLERTAMRTGAIEYVLMLYAGLRLGEACALTWECVDLETQTIAIRQIIQRVRRADGEARTCLALSAPKSASSAREIPIPAFLCAMLKARLRETGAAKADFVLAGSHGRAIDPRTVQKRFAALMKKLGIAGAHIHTLRHTYATRCLEKRVGFETLSLLLGHSSPRITMDYYAHATRDTLRKSVAKLKLLAG